MVVRPYFIRLETMQCLCPLSSWRRHPITPGLPLADETLVKANVLFFGTISSTIKKINFCIPYFNLMYNLIKLKTTILVIIVIQFCVF